MSYRWLICYLVHGISEVKSVLFIIFTHSSTLYLTIQISAEFSLSGQPQANYCKLIVIVNTYRTLSGCKTAVNVWKSKRYLIAPQDNQHSFIQESEFLKVNTNRQKLGFVKK